MNNHIGELAALATAFCWTVTGITYQIAGRKIGSVNVNMIRMIIAVALLSVYSYFAYGCVLPTNATTHNIIWLSVSGIIGFVIGDLMLFQAYVVVGARISMLIMTLSSPIAAIFGWIMLGETMSMLATIGMLLTMSGIGLVILEKPAETEANDNHSHIKFTYPIKGLLLAFGGALGQGVGLVFSKYGIEDLNAIQATQIRAIAAIIGFTTVFFVIRQWASFRESIKRTKIIEVVAIGSIFGPFIGVSLSLFAIQHTSTGIASTIMSLMPVIIIPPSILFFKEKVTAKEIIGAFIAVGGVALFFV